MNCPNKCGKMCNLGMTQGRVCYSWCDRCGTLVKQFAYQEDDDSNEKPIVMIPIIVPKFKELVEHVNKLVGK